MHFKDFHYPSYYKKLKRGPAVVHIKDIGLIMAYGDISKDDVVVEIGAGSGFLTIALAKRAKHVIAYERREEFCKIVKRNVEVMGLKNVSVKCEDGANANEEGDVLVLDVPNAEEVIEKVMPVVKPSRVVVHSLNIEQAKKAYETLGNYFGDVFMLSSLVFDYLVRENATRPKHKGLMHTAYLVFGRRE